MIKKILFFVIVMSATIVAIQTNLACAQTSVSVAAPVKATVVPTQVASTPATQVASTPATQVASTPATQVTATPQRYNYSGMNRNVGYYGSRYISANMYRPNRNRIGLGFDGIPLNGSHREAIQMRRAYQHR